MHEQPNFGIRAFYQAQWPGPATMQCLTSGGNGTGAHSSRGSTSRRQSSARIRTLVPCPGPGTGAGAFMPSFSHDGQKVVYISTAARTDGRPQGRAHGPLTACLMRTGRAEWTPPIPGPRDPATTSIIPSSLRMTSSSRFTGSQGAGHITSGSRRSSSSHGRRSRDAAFRQRSGRMRRREEPRGPTAGRSGRRRPVVVGDSHVVRAHVLFHARGRGCRKL